ncbi:MAG TPA: DinB family protein [Bryobacteraceae bacterium]|nr:DinB family protein [Bryobacteraceae bacterium]
MKHRAMFIKPLFLAIGITLFTNISNAQVAGGSFSAEVKQAYENVKKNLLKSADKIPDDLYGYMPTADERTVAEVLNHVVEAQTRTCSTVNGGMKAGKADGKTKADVAAALKDAFAECDKAYDSLTDANASEMFKIGKGQRSRLAALTGNISHDNEQYGILSVYMRLKGIIPPSSDAVPKR